MTELEFVVEEAVEGSFTARLLGPSIVTEGDTLDDLKVNIREAVDCHFDENERPKLIRLHILRDEVPLV